MSGGPLLLAPLRLEALALRRGSRRLEIEQIGMGPVRATAARVRLQPSVAVARPIVVAGVAGGLVPGLVAGDLVVATSIGSTESDESVELRNAEELAAHFERCGLAPRLAPVVCSPRILHGEERRAKAAASGAEVVEMESLWLTPLRAGRPFAVVRVVLDGAESGFGPASMPAAALACYRRLRNVALALESWSPEVPEEPTTRSR